MIYGMLNAAHRLLARSALATRGAVFVRNQCGQVIRYRLGESDDFEVNGENLLVQSVAPRCATAIDVGANVGGWTSRFLAACGDKSVQMLVLEPQSDCARRLRETVGQREGIVVLEVGAGAQAGELVLHEFANSELASFVDGGENAVSRTRVVSVTTLDEEVLSRGWETVDLLKVDAEGFDLHVLRGASRLLDEGRIGCLQFEYNRAWAAAGSTLAEAYDFLRERGYRTFVLRSTGLFELRYQLYGEYFAYSNFVSLQPRCLTWVEDLLQGPI